LVVVGVIGVNDGVVDVGDDCNSCGG